MTNKRPVELVDLDDTTPPLQIRRRISPAAAEQIGLEIEGAPVEPIARGGTPNLEMFSPAEVDRLAPQRNGGTPYTEVNSRLQSGASTVLYVPQSRQITPALMLPTRVSSESSPVRMVGDKKSLIEGYKQVSLCHVLTREAIQRAQAAIQILDKEHAQKVQARLQLAGLTNANAASRNLKNIPLKRAVAIASQAEVWVYQQQAAAAKHAAKEARACARRISGRGKLTTEQKAARWAAKHNGQARPDRTARAVAKYQRKIAKLQGAE